MKLIRLSLYIFLPAFLVCASDTVYADSIHLKNGNTIVGKVVGYDESGVTIKVNKGTVFIESREILDVKMDKMESEESLVQNHPTDYLKNWWIRMFKAMTGGQFHEKSWLAKMKMNVSKNLNKTVQSESHDDLRQLIGDEEVKYGKSRASGAS